MGASARHLWLAASTKNTGKFQKTGACADHSATASSVADAAIVTRSGSLADLTWTQLPTTPDAIFISTPVATTRHGRATGSSTYALTWSATLAVSAG